MARRSSGDAIFAAVNVGATVDVRERYFAACYPTGVVYCDRGSRKDGDYRRLAFLSYAALVLEWDRDIPRATPAELRSMIEADARDMQARRGQRYQIAGNMSVVLGFTSHDHESARAARDAHARLMRDPSAELYVYFKPYQLRALSDDEQPTGNGWSLAWPERVPGNLDTDRMVAWFAVRSRRVPYLLD